MSHRAAAACPVPVLLVRPGGDRVANPDLLGGGTSDLHPAFPLDDVDALASLLRVPLVADAGIESPNGGGGGERRARRRQQVACSRRTREVGRIQRFQVTQHLSARRNVHDPTLRDQGAAPAIGGGVTPRREARAWRREEPPPGP